MRYSVYRMKLPRLYGEWRNKTRGSTGNMHMRPLPRNKTARNTWLLAGIQKSCFSFVRVGDIKDRTAGWVARHLSLTLL